MHMKKKVRFQEQVCHGRDIGPDSSCIGHLTGSINSYSSIRISSDILDVAKEVTHLCLQHRRPYRNRRHNLRKNKRGCRHSQQLQELLTELPTDLFSISSTQDRRWDSSVSPTTPPQARPSSQIEQTSTSNILSDDLQQLLLGETSSSSSSSRGASSTVRMNDKSSKSNRNNYSPTSIPFREESTDSLLKVIAGRGNKGPSSPSPSSSSSPSFPTVTTPHNNIFNNKTES
jgi:hypothetical protein